MVTKFCPFTTDGDGETKVQFVELRLVTDTKLKPAALVDHERAMLAPCLEPANCGGGVVVNVHLSVPAASTQYSF